MSGERFYVVTLHAYPRAEGGGDSRMTDTSSVLDRAYAHREVARFERSVPAAAAEAARLNAWAATA